METKHQKPTSVHWARLVTAGILGVVAVAILVDNSDKTRVGYVFGDVRAPRFVLLLVAALLGAAIGWLLLHRPHRHDH